MVLRKTLKSQLLVWGVSLLAALSVQADTSAPAEGENKVAADEIVLKNGSRLFGSVTDIRDGVLTLETDFAGTLAVEMDQVESVHTQGPVVVLKTDESVVRDIPLQIDEELVLAPGAAVQSYPLEDLLVANPEPWELGQGYRWTGLVNVALAMQRGNTDTDELDYRLESKWRSKRDRYTFQAGGEKDEANGETNANNWKITGKYDYFLEDPNYVGLLAQAEKDEFQDLDLRYLIGPYIGRQFYDEPIFSMNGEFGVSYVTEEYNISEDQDYWASNWNLHASSDYLGGDSLLYFDQNGIWSLEDTSDVIVDTTFGLSFPLLWSLEAAAEILLEYDSGAVDGVDDMDETYKLRIGYTW